MNLRKTPQKKTKKDPTLTLNAFDMVTVFKSGLSLVEYDDGGVKTDIVMFLGKESFPVMVETYMFSESMEEAIDKGIEFCFSLSPEILTNVLVFDENGEVIDEMNISGAIEAYLGDELDDSDSMEEHY